MSEELYCINLLYPCPARIQGEVIEIQNEGVLFRYRKKQSKALITKFIPFAKIYSLQHDATGKGTIVYRLDNMEYYLNREYGTLETLPSGMFQLITVNKKFIIFDRNFAEIVKVDDINKMRVRKPKGRPKKIAVDPNYEFSEVGENEEE